MTMTTCVSFLFVVAIVIAATAAGTTHALSVGPLSSSSSSAATRDLSELHTWALQQGVYFAEGVRLERQNNNENEADWGVSLPKRPCMEDRPMTPHKTNGTATTTTTNSTPLLVLQVPRSLVWNAQTIYDELIVSSHFQLDAALEQLVHNRNRFLQRRRRRRHKTGNDADNNDGRAEFLLFLKLLLLLEKEEESRMPSSLSSPCGCWSPWLESLPRTFHTGVSMTVAERKCLPPISQALAEVNRIQYQQFCCEAARMLKAAAPPWCSSNHHATTTKEENNETEERYLWAYNVVHSRCWRLSQQENQRQDHDSLRDTDMVPMGDMFNHRHPANIVVQSDADARTVDFFYTGSSSSTTDEIENEHDDDDDDSHTSSTGLFLSYDHASNPHRFLVVFGFVDWSMVECDSEIAFPNPSSRHLELGCDDRSKMMFRCDNGAISNTVYDSVLYALLESRPEEQDASCDAHVHGDAATKAAMHRAYGRHVAAIIRNHVTSKLTELAGLSNRIKDLRGLNDTPNLALIDQQNIFLTNVFAKVKARLG